MRSFEVFEFEPATDPSVAEAAGGLAVEAFDRNPLTQRETEIIELASQGLREQDIAEREGIAPETVKAHLKHAYAKLGVSGHRAEAVNAVITKGIIEVEPHPRAHPLPRRQAEILRLIAAGLSNDQIVQQIGRSKETVKTHVRHILANLEAENRAHAVRRGYETGELELPLSR